MVKVNAYGPNMSLEMCISMFEEIYFATKNHERTDTQIMCRLLENVGNVGKYVLKEPVIDGIGKHLARTFGWFCGLAILLGRRSLGDYVWRKFPYACSYCGGAPCACGPTKKPANEALLDRLRRANQAMRPRTLREFQVMFSKIYVTRNLDSLATNAFQGVQAVLPFSQPELTTNLQVALAAAFGRLVEELGELTAGIRLRYFNPDHVSDEMADIFAWLMGISNLLNKHETSGGDFYLSDFVWQEYPGLCRFCGQYRCRCTSEMVEDVVTVAGILTSRHLDSLTGLGNRDAWNELCKTSETRSANVNKSLPLSLIMIDLDGFKLVNDTYGHEQGDAVLEDVARLIQTVAVPPGQAFRLGGDEFCIVLSNTPKTTATKLAERLCATIAKHEFRNIKGSDKVKIGVSVGVETAGSDTLIDGGKENDVLPSLYSLADKNMYSAKKAGKGRVVSGPVESRRAVARKTTHTKSQTAVNIVTARRKKAPKGKPGHGNTKRRQRR